MKLNRIHFVSILSVVGANPIRNEAFHSLSVISRNAQSCNNVPGFTFTADNEQVTCDWITSDSALTETRRSEWCNKQTSNVVDFCPTACNFCDCVNNAYFKFNVLITNGNGSERKPVGCGWLTEPDITDQQKQNRFNRWCLGDADVREQCNRVCNPDICEAPTDQCIDDPAFRFLVLTDNGDGQERRPVGCDWLTENGITPTQKGNRFRRWCSGDVSVNQRCFETCNPTQCATSTGPSLVHSPAPSPAEIDGDGDGCTDSTTFTFDVLTTNGDGIVTKSVGCPWLTEAGITEQQKQRRFNVWCFTDLVKGGCPGTCSGGCPTTAPSIAHSSEPSEKPIRAPTPLNCENLPGFQFDVLITSGNGRERKSVSCGWIVEPGITQAQKERRFQTWCVKDTRVPNGCGGTCGVCSARPSLAFSSAPSLAHSSEPSPVLSSKPSPFAPTPVRCDNIPNFNFNVKTTIGGALETKTVGCGWIVEQNITDTQRENRFNKWCLESDRVRNGCSGTCGVCSDAPTSFPSEKVEDEKKPTVSPGSKGKSKGKGKAPSSSPTISMMPTISLSPTKSKGKNKGKGKAPSSSPTISMMPTTSLSPTKSKGKNRKKTSASMEPTNSMEPTKNKKKSKTTKSPKTKKCTKPTGAKELGVSMSFVTGATLALEDLSKLCDGSSRRQLRILSEGDILGVSVESLDKVDDECVTGTCEFEAEGKVFYTGFDDAEKIEIQNAFFEWLNSIYSELVINTPSDKSAQAIGQSNGAIQAGEIVTDEEVGSSNTGLLLAGTLVAFVGVGAAFFMHKRTRDRRSSIVEDRSLVLDTNDRRPGDESIGFPVSSNSLNNEYEVLGKEIY